MDDEPVFSLKRYWVGWTMKTAAVEWHERRKGQPPIDVWVSGHVGWDGEWVTLVAVVDAVSEKQVWRGLGLLYGSTIQQRFIKRQSADYLPGPRFPGGRNRTRIPDKPNRYIRKGKTK